MAKLTQAQERALQAYPGAEFVHDRAVFRLGYEQAIRDAKQAVHDWNDWAHRLRKNNPKFYRRVIFIDRLCDDIAFSLQDMIVDKSDDKE